MFIYSFIYFYLFLYFDRKPIEFFFTACVGFRTQDFWFGIARFIPLGYTLNKMLPRRKIVKIFVKDLLNH